MVMKMNKQKFIEEISKRLNCDEDYARKIDGCIEENFIIGKKNKEKTINLLIERLDVSEEEANNIYNVTMEIITSKIKDKIKHPFKD